MTFEKVECDACNATILEATKMKCGGCCMPCYMQNNHGFRPSEIASINERGLRDHLIQWGRLVRRGVPDIRNPLVSEKLNQNVPIVFTSVTDYFRSTDIEYEGSDVLLLLSELRLVSNAELNKYISDVEEFIYGLVRARRS